MLGVVGTGNVESNSSRPAKELARLGMGEAEERESPRPWCLDRRLSQLNCKAII